MILVTLGTQKQQFTRLLDYIEKSDIKDEIIVQAGHTKYESKKMKIFDFIDYDKMNEYVEKADLIITHGGTGSIIGPLKKGKKVIACARKSKYLEHVDDHQEQIVDVFADEGYILKLDEDVSLSDLMKRVKTFKVKKFVSNTDKFIERIKKEIEIDRFSTRNYFFSILFVTFITLLLLVVLLRPQRDVSAIENRKLNKIYWPKFVEVVTGDYQDNLEVAFADQMILSATTKKLYNSINDKIRNLANSLLYSATDIIPMTKDYCLLGNTGYLMYCPKTFDYFKDGLVQNINTINSLVKKYNKVKFYAYRVITDEDLIDGEFNYEMEDYFKTNLNLKYASLSNMKSYDDYKKYFYKSDHHWNYIGSYEGYKETMNLLNEKLLYIPKGTTCFEHTYFTGSEANAVGSSIKDEFCVYNFDYYDMDETIYGVSNSYGISEEYMKGNYPKGNYSNHYGNYYGGNYGEVIFNNKNNNNSKNLLLLVDSMSNPVNKLIASSYKNTYVVDLRRFEKFKSQEFDLNVYLKEYKIDEVLFFGSIRFYASNEFIPKLS